MISVIRLYFGVEGEVCFWFWLNLCVILWELGE